MGSIGRNRDERGRSDKLHGQDGKAHDRAWLPFWPCGIYREAARPEPVSRSAVRNKLVAVMISARELHGQALRLHGPCNGSALPWRN
ncbi:unnamed protein product [Linum trigynum]|uniref:Uncharacterized protein n=1 Tax=Linum trigynum TaxID=586398 RepID=A0AAV2ET38_9ROSI